MTLRSDLEREPWAHDLFAILRAIERSHPDRPRIGDSASSRDEYVRLGEDPYLDFPASNISRTDQDREGRLRLYVKFLGLLGPQGPLPLSTTSEAYGWWLARDDSFARFLDLFNNRFLQLFFRAWADARPIAQHDRPDLDRFAAYLGSAIGIGSPIYQGLDSVPDTAKLAFAGLLAPKAKSATRLRGALGGLFGVDVDIEEFVGTHLPFDQSDRSRLGQKHATLGVDLLVGASVFSVEDKIRLLITTKNMSEYERFLPSGDRCEPVADLVFFYLGHELDWDLELALPAREVRPVSLGRFGRLGYTTWIQKNEDAPTEGYRRDARFHPAERIARRRQATA
ncbi:type VI secretion system baseplate subunit TssG [Enterovirga sp. CN4-39]|uniref:type VI secretion system baseplate subunit TssG n=1 Tax=Enterovirga sp. CN4-39 TaxID=3400910 RepID=UPI003C0317D6